MSMAATDDDAIGTGLRWAAAGVLVIGLHVGVGWLVVGRAMLPLGPDTAAPGIAIDLDPVAVPQDQTAPAPADPPPAAEPDPAPLPPVDPQPAPETASAAPEPTVQALEPPVSSAIEPVPLPPAPQLSKTPEGDAVLAPPPRPVAEPRQTASRRAVAPRPADRRAAMETRREAEERRARREAQATRQRTADRSTLTDQRLQQGAPAQERASASAGAVGSWRGQLAAHLNRFKRAPAEGGVGTARVSFTVDRNGGVSGVRLAASSGNSALDEAALAMVERANPVPAPPGDMGNRVSLSVPVHFSGS